MRENEATRQFRELDPDHLRVIEMLCPELSYGCPEWILGIYRSWATCLHKSEPLHPGLLSDLTAAELRFRSVCPARNGREDEI